jgi:hypothetical protein
MGVSDPAPPGPSDERRFPEKLDDLQAAHPFPYNLAAGVVVGGIAALFGFHWLVIPLYALSYATIRTYLWGEGRILQRQYEARKLRSDQARAQRHRHP